MKTYGLPLRISRWGLVGWLVTLTGSANANLQVYPTRLMLSERQRVTQVTLINNSTEPNEYRISLLFQKMKPDGTYAPPENPGPSDRSALKLLRFSPRRVKLGPKSQQVVRVIVAAPGTLPAGDYRAHIDFDPQDGERASDPASDPNSVKMQLRAKVRIRIPVIFRKGNAVAKIRLSDLKLIKGMNDEMAFSVQLHSEGNAFPYGEISLFFEPKGGESRRLAYIKGISSYLPQRTIQYPLNEWEKTKLSNGTLRAEFQLTDKDGKKEEDGLAKIEGKIH